MIGWIVRGLISLQYVCITCYNVRILTFLSIGLDNMLIRLVWPRSNRISIIEIISIKRFVKEIVHHGSRVIALKMYTAELHSLCIVSMV